MAVTVTYIRPFGQGTTPPTVQKVQRQCTVIAILSGVLLTDTQVFISHNLNLPASDISQGFPNVFFEPLDPSFYAADWIEVSQNPLFTMLGKTVSVGNVTGNQLKVTIDKRNTIAR
jgi:hypothetical protein